MNDPTSGVTETEAVNFVKNSTVLRVCADLANGSKHLKLERPKADAGTKIGRRHFDLQLGSGTPKIAVKYEVEAGPLGQYDAFQLAEKCLAEWDTFLKTKGLL